MPLSSEQRGNVVRAAKEWIGTPYHHKAAVKGAGADCAMFPIAVYKECGIIAADYQPPEYSTQWHLHRSDELYLKEVEKFAECLPRMIADDRGSECRLARISVHPRPSAVKVPQPADFVVFKFGRTFSHGAIVIAWPLIIHSYIPHGVTLADALTDGQLIGREYKVYEIG